VIAGLIAAAGHSTRMGQNKAAVARADGVPNVVALVDAFISGGCAPVVVTVPSIAAHADETRTLLANLAPVVVENHFHERGYTGSIHTALHRLADVDGLIVTPVDAPYATSTLIMALVAAIKAGHDVAVVACDGRDGHPIAFSKRMFGALLSLRDGGPRALVTTDTHRIITSDHRVLVNGNTPADVENSGGAS
jgi:CTP:molybdopterin cytidylyltransferase MocA